MSLIMNKPTASGLVCRSTRAERSEMHTHRCAVRTDGERSEDVHVSTSSDQVVLQQFLKLGA